MDGSSTLFKQMDSEPRVLHCLLPAKRVDLPAAIDRRMPSADKIGIKLYIFIFIHHNGRKDNDTVIKQRKKAT